MRRYPKLRDGLFIRKVVEGDDVAYTICDTPRDKYFRVDPVTHLVAMQLDGTRPLSEVSRLCQEQMPHTDLSIPAVEEAVQDLDAIGLLEDPYQKNILLLERARTRRPRLSDFLQNMFLWKIGVWNPEWFLLRTRRWVGWLFTPLPALLTAVAFALCVAGVLVQRDRLDLNLRHVLGFEGRAGAGVFLFWVIYIVTGVFHELGHAYACTTFGGQVPRVGIMLMYFIPCLYADVSTSMAFPNRWHRIWVAMGGVYMEVLVTIAAAFVWWFTPPELVLNDIAYRVMIVGFIAGVLMNLNPLIKLDGYYVLSDLLQIGELREGSIAFWKSRVLGLFRRHKEADTVRGIRRRRAYAIYGAVAIVYTATILTAFFGWLHSWLVSKWAETGFVLSIAAVALVMKQPLASLAGRLRSVRFPRNRKSLLGAAAVLLALFVIRFLPAPAHVVAEATVISARRETVNARERGTVLAILARQGDRVAPHQVVAIVGNDSLSSAWSRTRARSESQRLDVAQAIAARDPSSYRAADARFASAAAREEEVEGAVANLALAAEEGGRVVTPRVEEAVGRWVELGDTLMIIEADGPMRVEFAVHQADVGLLRPGQRFQLRVRADPGRSFTGRIDRISPESTPGNHLLDPQFRTVGSLDVALRAPLGGTGIVRVDVGRWTLYERLIRLWARYVRADFWL